MRELVVVSGKGGAGKTSVLAAFAALAERPVLADCDVDASDLPLVLEPQVRQTHDFVSGHAAVVKAKLCRGCGACVRLCRFEAITLQPRPNGRSLAVVDPAACEGCGVCVRFCPQDALDFPERHCGVWMESETRFGPLVHAELGVTAENSGKLVSIVRDAARRIAEKDGRDLILIDGPPGVGCPAIASITNTKALVAVSEPTPSGAHDLGRLLELARHFRVPAFVCVNKWDISPEMTATVERLALENGARLAGRIRYDRAFTAAQMKGATIIETDAPSAADVKAVWQFVTETLQKETP
jgi:MinD superfamily P-loop ATPase